MKLRLLLCCSALMLALSVHGGLITYRATSGTIPDGNPAGWSATATVSGYLPSITDVTVHLEISGGYNGDLYAYLSYGGVLLPLLNRVGVTAGDPFGYGTEGMHVTLADGYSDIHGVEFPTSEGFYSADGRNISPLSDPSAFDTASRLNFGAFDGMNPNGTWTIFFADLSSGAESQLVSWSLGITAVPEPVNVALGVFAGLFVVVTLARNRGVRGRFHNWRVAVVNWIDAV
jgi:hypothetical protein